MPGFSDTVADVSILILSEPEIAGLLTPAEAMTACRDAYQRLAQGQVMQPEVMSYDFPERSADMHVKGGYLHGTDYFSFKAAGAWYNNPARGLPALGGAVFVWDVHTGALRGIFLDNGYLTNLRTAAAGAIAVDLMAKAATPEIAVIGAGVLARYLIEATLAIRTPRRVRVWSGGSRGRAAADALVLAMAAAHSHVNWQAVDSPQHACTDADVILTATPSRTPIVQAAWVKPGAHISALGSDMPGKQELDPLILARASVITDNREHCATHGELQHAIAAGLMLATDVRGNMGDVLLGRVAGRVNDQAISVADLCGVGALDAAMANLVITRALAQGIGKAIT